MPTKKPKAKTAAYVRKTPSVSLTLSHETLARLDKVLASHNELRSRSQAVEWAVRVATAKGGES